MARTSSLSEKPLGDRPRRLVHWLALAWEKVRRNKGAGGIDGQSVADFERDLNRNLKKLHNELCTQTYQPQPVKRQLIPKSGQPGKFRPLGIPNVYDRVCQQALLN